jgi:hypothetical protein
MFSHWPLAGLPQSTCRTRRFAVSLLRKNGLDRDAAIAMVDRINGLAPTSFVALMNRIPPEWLGAGLNAQLEGWWGSPAFNARLRELREGLHHGSFL